MTNPSKTVGKPAIESDILTMEHLQIHCRYAELDDAILQGLGSPRIIESAGELVRAMLLHFIHVEQLVGKIMLSCQEEQRNADKKALAEVLRIEAGLMKEDVHAALRLRGLCKRWIHEHMHVEDVEFSIPSLMANNEASRISGAGSSASLP